MTDDEKLVSDLVAKLDYLSKWMPDIWLALKQKGQDMSDKDIALIGQKIRNISGGGGIDAFLPTCYTIDSVEYLSTDIENKTAMIAICNMGGSPISVVPIVEVNLEEE